MVNFHMEREHSVIVVSAVLVTLSCVLVFLFYIKYLSGSLKPELLSLFDGLRRVFFQGRLMSSVFILTLQFSRICSFLNRELVIPLFPAILLQPGSWLGSGQEGSHRRVSAPISPFGGNGSDFSASPVQH